MAKAATRTNPKGGKALPKAQGAAPRGKRRSRRPKTWVKVLALIILFPFAAVLLPTTLVFFVMMSPTWVAYMTDRSREKHLAVTVGMLNFAGTLPAIIELWTRGQSHQMAMDLISDVFVWVVAYGAAFAGWTIFAFMPALVGNYYLMTTRSRMKGLVKAQKALIAEWGDAVAAGIAPAIPGEGDDDEDADTEASGEAGEFAEAEAMPSRAAR
ncbi:MAG: hypothetical protein ACFCUW_17185 [Kiloniellaceae bacterium]